ncbi:MAG: bifunctional hydroxymethylpyrimidine kinase/phosphomethylpyrimidine kinase, partial [Verrucomicrobia bacterium]|nr:bifunctional hydroxymethylpyrimidine kinase/phosphomethylpyrimidine kinase [Verrucomicrobiota bacterium]
ATSGAALLKPEAERSMAELLFSKAALVTPNLDEAARLVGRKLRNPEQAKEAARELAKKWKVPFLVKGGHLNLAKAEDYLAWPNGRLKTFSAIRCKGVETHGTGCTYSAAICAGLAQGAFFGKSSGEGEEVHHASHSGPSQIGSVYAFEPFAGVIGTIRKRNGRM